MYLKQADLFWGMSQHIIQAITSKGIKQEFKQGDIIFNADDPAEYFYVLIKGKVRVDLPVIGRSVYSSDRVGELFGWSALIRREDYSATVACEKQTIALRFKCDEVCRLLEQDTDSAAIFYKQLASALGKRLLTAYGLLE
jgi:CRP/FNR family transcriptional regulator, cyclic AMP receptor protein